MEAPELERQRFLDSACGGDADLRAEVDRLLAASQEASWSSPAATLFPVAAELVTDDTVAQYHIEARLGEGGMGMVYRAYDTRLEREVALKVLPPEDVDDPDRRQQLMREARAASALTHSNIVTGQGENARDNARAIAIHSVSTLLCTR